MSDSANDPTQVACAAAETTDTPDMSHHNKEEQPLLQQEQQRLIQTPEEASFEEKESHDTNELLLSKSEETDESGGDDNSLVAASEDMSQDSASPTAESPADEIEEAPAVETEKAPGDAAVQKKDADCGNEKDDESYEYVDSDIDSNDSHNQSNSSSFLDLTPQREYWKWDPVWEHIKQALEQKKFCDPVALSQNEAFVRNWQEQHPPQQQQQGNENAPRARAVTVESVESHPKVATFEEDHLEDWWKVAVSHVQQLLQDDHQHHDNKDSMAKMSETDDSLLELLEDDDEELEEGIIVEEYIETTSSTSATWQLLEHVLVAMMILLAGLYLGKKLGLEFEITPSQEAAPARFLFP